MSVFVNRWTENVVLAPCPWILDSGETFKFLHCPITAVKIAELIRVMNPSFQDPPDVIDYLILWIVISVPKLLDCFFNFRCVLKYERIEQIIEYYITAWGRFTPLIPLYLDFESRRFEVLLSLTPVFQISLHFHLYPLSFVMIIVGQCRATKTWQKMNIFRVSS